MLNGYKNSIALNEQNLSNLFIKASTSVDNSSLSVIKKLRSKSFLTFMKDYNGTASNMEDNNKTKAFKYNLSTHIDSNLTHNGTTYGTVMSPYTGKIWLDRNLGATQVCTVYNDTACYGDYYQWGRDYGGHQESNSTTTSTPATDINVTTQQNIVDNNGSFILVLDWVTSDTNGSIRSANWSKTDGSSVCPIGYRVPTLAEIIAETIGLSGADDVKNRDNAFNNFLKLPSAGRRYDSMQKVGIWAYVWTSSFYNSQSRELIFRDTSVAFGNNYRLYGQSVRCVKD